MTQLCHTQQQQSGEHENNARIRRTSFGNISPAITYSIHRGYAIDEDNTMATEDAFEFDLVSNLMTGYDPIAAHDARNTRPSHAKHYPSAEAH